MTVRHTVDSITSDALDQLYRERDEARQHAATIAAQRDRLRQRMHALADRWDTAVAPDKPYARALRAEISVAPFDPNGAMIVQEYREHGRTLWAFRCWGTDTCDGWLGLGHHTETSELLERERHVAEEHGEQPAPAPAATQAGGASDYVLTFDHPPTPAERQQIATDLERHQPKEQLMPTDQPTCTATIEGPHVLGGGPITCTREAGHPANHVGPQQDDDGKTMWTDWTAGATPHRPA